MSCLQAFTPNCQVHTVTPEELILPCPIRCEFSCLRCHGQLVTAYLQSSQNQLQELFSAAPVDTLYKVHNLNHLDCPVSQPLRKSIFSYTLFILDPDLQVWPHCWVSFSTPPSRKECGNITTKLY